MKLLAQTILILACTASLAGCSIRSLAINSLADALADSGSVYASDSDPDLVREALPFALKTFESLLDSAPGNQGLLLSTCSGFTQYAYAFVEADAARLEFTDYRESRRQAERALNLYLRARGYCLRALELDHPGITERLIRHPAEAASELEAEEIERIYWTAAAWGSAVSAGVHRLDIVADLPAVRALFDRALELDESYSDGAIHDALISLEALPEAMGGSAERAREHFERAVELSGGHSAGPYVSFARNVMVPAQDAAGFDRLLGEALAIDPDATPEIRLANLVAQSKARFLRDHIDDFFLESLPEK